MGRLAWSQARFRPARTLALIAGLLVAAAAFTVLTAASRTAQLRTTGTVSANFRPAYGILVRPRGARTAQENRTGTVQPDFLSGIYGGITMAQYHQIQHIPGIHVAAPIASRSLHIRAICTWLATSSRGGAESVEPGSRRPARIPRRARREPALHWWPGTKVLHRRAVGLW